MEIKLFVLVDADGTYTVGIDEGELSEKFVEDNGDPVHPTRMLEVSICLPTPSNVMVSVDLPPKTENGVTMKVEG